MAGQVAKKNPVTTRSCDGIRRKKKLAATYSPTVRQYHRRSRA